MSNAPQLVQKLWNYCNILRDDGLSYGEISEVTGMTENHVGVGLTRARKQLAQLMKGATDELE